VRRKKEEQQKMMIVSFVASSNKHYARQMEGKYETCRHG
jgi:hypothetical protein